jgi:hypothetical protein
VEILKHTTVDDTLSTAKIEYEAFYKHLISETAKKYIIKSNKKWDKELEEQLKDTKLPEDMIKNTIASYKQNAEYEIGFMVLKKIFELQKGEQIFIEKELVKGPSTQAYYEFSRRIFDSLFSIIGLNKTAEMYCDPSITAYIKLYPDFKLSKKQYEPPYEVGVVEPPLTHSKIVIHRVTSDRFEDTYIEIPEEKQDRLTEEDIKTQDQKYQEEAQLALDFGQDNMISDVKESIYKEQHTIYSKEPKIETKYHQAYLICEGHIYQINIAGLRG